MRQTTAIIGRNFTEIEELQTYINGLFGRGISGNQFEGLVVKNVYSFHPFFRITGNFDVLVIVELGEEEEEDA